ncbi:methyl-accepting chemotaxis protein [Paenibacillus shirakamiensis]|uniref:Methyl-accepting chemotaxis protein n=1 Tax=Paenibacillus shirakamiensis TaxID=1265935 RepID=A0ABS4JJJ7_9BACL|nr:methyl-accepting chemotaxis protein [Paenibacillus shirakamiensis]MBP2001876.1 methyl-accepting chemotaxis protein [Paenibacillus shirakamiensis]
MKVREKRRYTIRKRLIVSFTCLLVIPSLIIGGIIFSVSTDSLFSELVQDIQENVKLADKTLTEKIKDKTDDTDFIAKQFASVPMSAAGEAVIVGNISNYLGLNKDIDNVFIVTDEGVAIQGKKGSTAYVYANPKQESWYTSALAHPDQTIVSNASLTKDNLPVLFISRKLSDGSGVVVMTLDLHYLNNQLNMKLGTSGYVLVVDQQKHYVIGPKDQAAKEAKESFIPLLMQSKGAPVGLKYTNKNEALRLQAITNAKTGWVVAGFRDQVEINKIASKSFYISIAVLVGCLLLGGMVVAFIIRSIISPIRKLQQETKKVSAGDLTVNVVPDKNDEIGDLAVNFSIMVKGLREMIDQVRDTSHGVTASAEQLSAGAEQTTRAIEHVTVNIQEVASGSQQQLHSVEQGVEIIDSMSQEARSISDHMQEVTNVMQEASHIAEGGTATSATVVQKMDGIHLSFEELSTTIQNLNHRVEQIGGTVQGIAAMAKQTNLLALNASIEAARAGEHGRGFAVVASEVRKLAEGSSQSASQIQDQVTTIRSEMEEALVIMKNARIRVNEGSQAVDISGQSFNVIREAVQSASKQIVDMTQAALHLTQGATEVAESIEQVRSISESGAELTHNISAAAEEQLASVEEIASSAAELSRMAEDLSLQISRFKVD